VSFVLFFRSQPSVTSYGDKVSDNSGEVMRSALSHFSKQRERGDGM